MKELFIRFFQLESHGSTLQREVIGGITTFLAMSYIIFVQPEWIFAPSWRPPAWPGRFPRCSWA
jgi:AGZA family xanthine/uracil permease-like MFS transporter